MECRKPKCVAAREVVAAVVAEQLAAQATYSAEGMAVGRRNAEWLAAWQSRVAAVNRWLRKWGAS